MLTTFLGTSARANRASVLYCLWHRKELLAFSPTTTPTYSSALTSRSSSVMCGFPSTRYQTFSSIFHNYNTAVREGKSIHIDTVPGWVKWVGSVLRKVDYDEGQCRQLEECCEGGFI